MKENVSGACPWQYQFGGYCGIRRWFLGWFGCLPGHWWMFWVLIGGCQSALGDCLLSQVRISVIVCSLYRAQVAPSMPTFFKVFFRPFLTLQENIVNFFLMIWGIIHMCSTNVVGQVMCQSVILRFMGLFKSLTLTSMNNSNSDSCFSTLLIMLKGKKEICKHKIWYFEEFW